MLRPLIAVVVGLIALAVTAYFVAANPASDAPEPRAADPSAATARLVIKLTDVRSDRGQLIFGVFRSEKGFPSSDKHAVNWQVRKAGGEGIEFVAELPPGVYAASILHDENSNNKMDTNLIGIPTEGYGVTNNPKPKFRGAKYKEATITLPEGGAEFTISLQYF